MKKDANELLKEEWLMKILNRFDIAIPLLFSATMTVEELKRYYEDLEESEKGYVRFEDGVYRYVPDFSDDVDTKHHD